MTKLTLRGSCLDDGPEWNSDVPRWSTHDRLHDDVFALLADIDSQLCEVDALRDAAIAEVVDASEDPIPQVSIDRAKSIIGQIFASDCVLSKAYVDEAGLMLRWAKGAWRFTAIVGEESDDLTIQAVRFSPNIRLIFVPDAAGSAVAEVLTALPRA